MKKLILRGPGLFRKRDSEGAYTDIFSSATFWALLNEWDVVDVVVSLSMYVWGTQSGRDQFMADLEAEVARTPKVTIFSVPSAVRTTEEMTAWWAEFLPLRGVALRGVDDEAFSYLNVGRFMADPGDTVVGPEYHPDVNVEPEYPPTLQSTVKEREEKGSW